MSWISNYESYIEDYLYVEDERGFVKMAEANYKLANDWKTVEIELPRGVRTKFQLDLKVREHVSLGLYTIRLPWRSYSWISGELEAINPAPPQAARDEKGTALSRPSQTQSEF
jgi:hypothetical protein